MNKYAPKKKAAAPVEVPELRKLWAEAYANPVKVAEIKAEILANTKLKTLDKGDLSILFLTDSTAGIIYYKKDDPVAFLSMDWADVMLRITYVQW